MRRLKFVGLCLIAFLTVGFSHVFKADPSVSVNASDLSSVPSTAVVSPIAQALPTNSKQSQQSLTVNVHYRYYPITGKTATQLRNQMNQKGPIDRLENRRYDAVTNWAITWAYQYSRSSHQCSIRSAKMTVEVTYTYPQWQIPANAPQPLVKEWQRYMSALQIHEEGHKDNGVSAGQEILQMLNRFPAYPSCQQLETAANSAAQAISRRHNQQDLDYDYATRHGYTQGAVFPSTLISER